MTEFVLLEPTEPKDGENKLHLLCFFCHLGNVAGNVLIMVTIRVSPLPSFSMYIFLAHLSLLILTIPL